MYLQTFQISLSSFLVHVLTFFDEIIENGLPFTKETEVIMVCVDGKKTNRYSKFLNKKGLNVVSLKGGIMAWREKGLPIARNVMKLR